MDGQGVCRWLESRASCEWSEELLLRDGWESDASSSATELSPLLTASGRFASERLSAGSLCRASADPEERGSRLGISASRCCFCLAQPGYRRGHKSTRKPETNVEGEAYLVAVSSLAASIDPPNNLQANYDGHSSCCCCHHTPVHRPLTGVGTWRSCCRGPRLHSSFSRGQGRRHGAEAAQLP